MENLKEYIEKRIPEAVEEGGEILTLKVEPGAFRELAVQLRNDFGFDYLVCMTGMDWGEKLGVIYHFRSTLSGENLVVKTEAFDRENPELFTVYDLWATAGLNEREIFDFFGIRFINHPDMRRLFLRNDWVGYPLRKDYDTGDTVNPVRWRATKPWTSLPYWRLRKTVLWRKKSMWCLRIRNMSSILVPSILLPTVCCASGFLWKGKS